MNTCKIDETYNTDCFIIGMVMQNKYHLDIQNRNNILTAIINKALLIM